MANLGPIGGILSALATHPNQAWLVVACDLPRLNLPVLQHLVRHRSTESLAVAYRSAYDGQPEPLCAVYEPTIAPLLRRYVADAGRCPRRALRDLAVPLLDLPDDRALDNINAPAEFEAAREELAGQ